MLRVSMLVGATALLFLAACIQVAPTPEPAGTPTPTTPITREQAIEIALRAVSMPQPEISAVENPRNPVARLMTRTEWWDRRSGRTPVPSGYSPDMLVWVVQFEGTSYSAGIGAVPPLRPLNYATVAIDAQSGNVIGADYTYAPLL